MGEPENDTVQRIIDSEVYCDCEAGQQMFLACLQARVEERRQWKRGVRLLRWQNSGIPPRFAGASFKTTTQTLIASWMQEDEAPKSWLLHGETGRGKTGLAVAYCRRWVFPADPDEMPLQVWFRTLPDLLMDLKGTFGQPGAESELLEFFASVPLLVLDDIGAEQPNRDYNADRLYQLISRRHGAELPTVMTSNLNPAALEKRLGERITWRILEMAGPKRVVEVVGPNLRNVQ